MARTSKDAPLTTRNARKALKVRKKPFRRSLGPGAFVCYQRRARGGVWKVALYIPQKRDYRYGLLGVADDVLAADGNQVLDYEQAKKAAVEKIASWHAEMRAEGRASDRPPPTVRGAVEAYISMRDGREREQSRTKGDARRRLAYHVLADEIADVPLAELTEDHLTEWQKRRQTGLAPATIRRIINDFKACLNAAARKHRQRVPADMPTTIKNALAVHEASQPAARDGAALPDAEVRRILKAAGEIDSEDGWDGDLLRLVAVLAGTGARFSQVARMTVANVQAAQARLMIPVSRKGKGTKNSSHTGIRVGADIIDLMRPVIAGRRPGEPLLERWRHKQVKGTDTQPPRWVRNTRGPWRDSPELGRAWVRIVRRAGLPADVVPYSLRHSSIVRMLRSGLPTRLVAELHDTSTGMIEKHYAASVTDVMDDLAARAIVPLLPEAAGQKVVPLRTGQV